MRVGTTIKFSPYFFPLSRSRVKIEKSTQYHGTVENKEQGEGQNTAEKEVSQFESCLRNHVEWPKWIHSPETPEKSGVSTVFAAIFLMRVL